MKKRLFWGAIIVLAVYAFILQIPAFGEEDDDHISWLTIENGYLGVAIGNDGAWQVSPFGHNHWEGLQPISGRFDIYRTGGNPLEIADDGVGLVYSPFGNPGPGDAWMAYSLMVDGLSDEETPSMVWATFDRGNTSGIIGDEQNGWWDIYPYIPDNERVIRAVAYPVATGGINPQGASVSVVPPRIKCELEIRVMRDTARIKWILTNEDMMNHRVGLKLFMDAMPSMTDDGTEDYRNIISIPGYPLLTSRTTLLGNDVPEVIEMFNSPTEPTLTTRMILRGQDATTPDAVGVDNWARFYMDGGSGVSEADWTFWYDNTSSDPYLGWTYETISHNPIVDIGYGAFWKPKILAPGGSYTIISYIGLADSTSDFTKPSSAHPQYVAGVQGPRTLRYYDSFGVGSVYPDSFDITAYMEEIEKGLDILNPSFTLTLPDGLVLDPSEGGKYTKSIARISEGSEAKISWKVIPVNNPTGILTYSVAFNSQLPTGTIVSRKINIPATQWKKYSKSWQMISVPFELDNTDPAEALGLNLTPGTEYRFWRYDPHLRQYQPVYQLKPGEAYWLWLSNEFTTAMTPGDYHAIPWIDTKGKWLDLQTGWNLIGNPFVYTVTLGELKFYHETFGVLTYEEAVESGLISRTVFWWDTVFRKYNWSSKRDIQLKPWQGYWVKALQSGVSLIVTPESQIGASIGGNPSGGGGGGVIPPPNP